jgi:hypothetical protein
LGEPCGRAGPEPDGQVAGDDAGVVGAVDEVVDQPTLGAGLAESVGAEPAADRVWACLGGIGGAERGAQPGGGISPVAKRDRDRMA